MSDEAANVAHDAWTTLAALAARTTTLRLGTLVSPATFRLPALLANAAATADHVSGGRIELGLGAGWMEREHRAFGFPFPETGVRVAMFAEQLEIVHRLWTRGSRRLQRHALRARGRARAAEAGAASASAAARRRRREARHRRSCCALRGRVQHAVRLAGGVRGGSRARDRGVRANRPRSGDDAVLDDDRLRDRRDARRRARTRTRAATRACRATASFDAWLDGYAQRALVGSVDEVAARLREYESAGCDRVMLQHILHADLEPVRLIGRELAPALA